MADELRLQGGEKLTIYDWLRSNNAKLPKRIGLRLYMTLSTASSPSVKRNVTTKTRNERPLLRDLAVLAAMMASIAHTLRTDMDQKHIQTLEAVRATAAKQVPFNVQR
ncbi:hypothetical protein FRC10_002650, partial [Ceratobasidium sp. 414]